MDLKLLEIINMENNKIKILALFGESGSGKDTIQNTIAKCFDVNKIILCTTRPPRDYEKDGYDYFFTSNDYFERMILDNQVIEYTVFNNWYYGTPVTSLTEDKTNIGVFNIDGIKSIIEDPRLETLPVYIYSNEKERLMRCLNREKNPDCNEICRRFLADKEDFSNIPFNYYTIRNLDCDKDSSFSDLSFVSKFING